MIDDPSAVVDYINISPVAKFNLAADFLNPAEVHVNRSDISPSSHSELEDHSPAEGYNPWAYILVYPLDMRRAEDIFKGIGSGKSEPFLGSRYQICIKLQIGNRQQDGTGICINGY